MSVPSNELLLRHAAREVRRAYAAEGLRVSDEEARRQGRTWLPDIAAFHVRLERRDRRRRYGGGP